MTSVTEKRILTQFETTEEEKEVLKEFVDKKSTTMSNFIRSCIRFFIDRNMTAEEYLMQEFDNKIVSEGDIPAKFLTDLEERDSEIKNVLNNIHEEMRSMKNNISNEFIEYLTMIAEELKRTKGSD